MSKFVVHVEEIAIAVNNANKVASEFSELFDIDFNYEWKLDNEHLFVKSARVGDTQLQFIEATDPNGVVKKFIDKKGEGLNHIALKVKNLDGLLEQLRKKGVKLIPDKPVLAESLPPFDGKIRYIFIHPSSFHGVLIELIEEY